MQITESFTTECADKILVALPVIMRALWQRLQAETPVTVTWTQFGLLSLLYDRHHTLTELSHKWGVSKPTMSRMVRLLIERGWVVSQEDPTNRRRKPLRLTPAGQEIHERMREAVRQQLTSSLESLDDVQYSQIASVLDLLIKIFT